MKRFFYLLMNLWRQQFRFYLAAGFMGSLVGVFILYPINDFVYFYEHGVEEPNVLKYVLSRIKLSIAGQTPKKTLFYAEVGTVLGLVIAWLYGFAHQKLLRIQLLRDELERDIASIIVQGEGPMLEFKSSFRWDYEQTRTNKALENVILKTLAGFMNSRYGGTLLIGVADDGRILGLEKDYQSLNRKDQDGFEQAIMTSVSKQLGTDISEHVKVLYHVVEGKDVCRLIVRPAPRPVFLNQGKDPKFYLRTGGGTRDLNIQEATEYITSRWHK